MRDVSYLQYAIVSGDTAQQLTERLNKALYDLRDKRPAVTFEGLIARISYTEEESTPDCLADEYAAVGVRLTCNDCPCFEPKLNRDGSRNRAAKWGNCTRKQDMASCESPACEFLFMMINNGEVKLCLDSE